MKVALVNPRWTFDGSIYFGCRAPHLPLELGYAKALLEQGGHEVLLVDGHLLDLSHAVIADQVRSFRADMTVVTTAPTYLFWRCAPPELRVPRELLDAISTCGGLTVAVGPHGSSTPAATLRKLGVDVVVQGECEQAIRELADHGPGPQIDGLAYRAGDGSLTVGAARASRFIDTPALHWSSEWIERHAHHHHRFDAIPERPGAEVEASRGCPYACTFCAKNDFRDRYRKRAAGPLLEEIDGLIAQGVGYLYFIDEIFLPDRPLLEALADRGIAFGVQTRIDLWKPELIELLGRAGCVSIEAGVESLTEKGRDALAKRCRMTTDELRELLLLARRAVPFVQANLIASEDDDASEVARWRNHLREHGVWANDPVPLYPYPSSPEYVRLFGVPDDAAWERSHEYYLEKFAQLSEIQEQRPLPLDCLEDACR